MIPLPERIRPRTLAEVCGQEHLLAPGAPLALLAASGRLPSCVLWGPPGCGKTTIARLLAEAGGMHLEPFSAVLGGLPELRTALKEAAARTALGGRTLLFIDEIHRFSKAQQDALLPPVERGDVVLVGATTENPSASINPALQSRLRVFSLRALGADGIAALVARAAAHADGLPGLVVEPAALDALVRLGAGDGRRTLLLLETAHALAGGPVVPAHIEAAAQQQAAAHDRAGDAHYDVASAFIKSMRASDPQAALFWLARQLDGGEDPVFVARRLVIFACEDVGLADPQALVVAQAALAATQAIGLPEAVYPLTQATLYNATAPKSNGTKAYFAAAEASRRHPGARVPLFLRNATNAHDRAQGHGQGYRYDHDQPGGFAGQACLPGELAGTRFYEPSQFGFEKEIAKRMAWWDARRSGG